MAISQRFNDIHYLVSWKAGDGFPAIHDDIFNMVQEVAPEGAILDLCCSTGLLAQRFLEAGRVAYGIDGDRAAIARSMQYGIKVDLHAVNISPAAFPFLESFIESHEIRTIVARRCLPELFGQDLGAGRAFAALLQKCGIQHVFIEGRIPVKAAVNLLATIQDEVALFEERYRLAALRGRVAHLEKL